MRTPVYLNPQFHRVRACVCNHFVDLSEPAVVLLKKWEIFLFLSSVALCDSISIEMNTDLNSVAKQAALVKIPGLHFFASRNISYSPISSYILKSFLKVFFWKKEAKTLRVRCEQGLNLRGETPLDFESNALTSRPSQLVKQLMTVHIQLLNPVVSFIDSDTKVWTHCETSVWPCFSSHPKGFLTSKTHGETRYSTFSQVPWDGHMSHLPVVPSADLLSASGPSFSVILSQPWCPWG